MFLTKNTVLIPTVRLSLFTHVQELHGPFVKLFCQEETILKLIRVESIDLPTKGQTHDFIS